MTSPLDSKLVEALTRRIDEIDENAIDKMASGDLRDYGEYKFSAGYRKCLRDMKVVLNETFDEMMKE